MRDKQCCPSIDGESCALCYAGRKGMIDRPDTHLARYEDIHHKFCMSCFLIQVWRLTSTATYWQPDIDVLT